MLQSCFTVNPENTFFQHGSETITELNLWPTNIIPVGVQYVLDQTERKILLKYDSATMFTPCL